MIQLKEIYKFKTGGDGKSHKAGIDSWNKRTEFSFSGQVKGDLIGCFEIWTSRSPAQGSLGNQGEFERGHEGIKRLKLDLKYCILFYFFEEEKTQLFWKRFKNFYRIRPVRKVVLESTSPSATPRRQDI